MKVKLPMEKKMSNALLTENFSKVVWKSRMMPTAAISPVMMDVVQRIPRRRLSTARRSSGFGWAQILSGPQEGVKWRLAIRHRLLWGFVRRFFAACPHDQRNSDSTPLP